MSTYRQVKGYNIKKVSSDPSNVKEGQVWYNSVSGTIKLGHLLESWASGGNLGTTRRYLAGCGTQTAAIAAGGQSINLHDQTGDFPRVSLIVPSYSSTQLIQALGRIHRARSKSPATQRIIFCSGTVEDHIAKRLKAKINFDPIKLKSLVKQG